MARTNNVPQKIWNQVLAVEGIEEQWALLNSLCQREGYDVPQRGALYRQRFIAQQTRPNRSLQLADGAWERIIAAHPNAGAKLEAECEALGIPITRGLYNQLYLRLPKE